MTLGELNFEDTYFSSSATQAHLPLKYPVTSYVIFILFCLGMPIILMNMLVSVELTFWGRCL